MPNVSIVPGSPQSSTSTVKGSVVVAVDRMTAAVNNLTEEGEFQKQYQALLRHYELHGEKIQTGQAQENGDIEQRHHRFKRALDQALLLRGHRDFDSVAEYQDFLTKLALTCLT